MKSIPFTQYLLPKGTRKPVEIEVSDLSAAKFSEAERLGCSMTCERLTTGEISLCIAHEAGDFDCLVVPEGPGVPEAVETMLLRFTPEAFNAWHMEMTAP